MKRSKRMMSSHNSTPERRRGGFTLMETILAVSLSAILLMLVGSAITLYSRIVRDRRADVVNAQTARAILHRIAEDIRGSVYFESDDESADASLEGADDLGAGDDLSSGGDLSSGDTIESDFSMATADLMTSNVQPAAGLYGNAYELQIDMLGRFVKPVKYDTLAAAGLDPQAVNLWSDPKVVTYFVRPSDPNELVGTPLQRFDVDLAAEQNVLIRRVESRAQAVYGATYGDISTSAQGEQFLSDEVAALTFSYFDGLQWLDEWDSATYGGLPLAVQITLVMLDPDAEASGTLNDLSGVAMDNVFQLTVSLPLADGGMATDDAALSGGL